MRVKPKYFQDYMPGNVCFGCGNENHQGLQIKSFWEGDMSTCRFMPEEKHNGWKNVLNGGIIATLVDCHCMGTAAANAYKEEERELGSFPEYRYATGTLSIKYLKPTSNNHEVELRAKIKKVKGRVTTLTCDVFSEGVKTAECEVVAIRVFDESQIKKGDAFNGGKEK